MKSREIKDLKNKPVGEMEKLLKESQEKLRTLRFDLAAGKVKDVAAIRSLRKDIARMITFVKLENESAAKNTKK